MLGEVFQKVNKEKTEVKPLFLADSCFPISPLKDDSEKGGDSNEIVIASEDLLIKQMKALNVEKDTDVSFIKTKQAMKFIKIIAKASKQVEQPTLDSLLEGIEGDIQKVIKGLLKFDPK